MHTYQNVRKGDLREHTITHGHTQVVAILQTLHQQGSTFSLGPATKTAAVQLGAAAAAAPATPARPPRQAPSGGQARDVAAMQASRHVRHTRGLAAAEGQRPADAQQAQAGSAAAPRPAAAQLGQVHQALAPLRAPAKEQEPSEPTKAQLLSFFTKCVQVATLSTMCICVCACARAWFGVGMAAQTQLSITRVCCRQVELLEKA